MVIANLFELLVFDLLTVLPEAPQMVVHLVELASYG